MAGRAATFHDGLNNGIGAEGHEVTAADVAEAIALVAARWPAIYAVAQSLAVNRTLVGLHVRGVIHGATG